MKSADGRVFVHSSTENPLYAVSVIQRAAKKGNSLGEMQTTSQEAKNADTAKIEGMKLEEALDELARLLDRMEEGDLPLEESFHLYRQGMKLAEYCNGQLDDVEKQVKKIGADGELEPFA